MGTYYQKTSDFKTRRNAKIDEVNDAIGALLPDWDGYIEVLQCEDRVQVALQVAEHMSCSACCELDENWKALVERLADFSLGAVEDEQDGDNYDDGPVTEYIGPKEVVVESAIKDREGKIARLQAEIADLRKGAAR